MPENSGTKRRFTEGVSAVNTDRAPTLVAIGNFDGVHLGHQAVISHAASQAQKQGLRPVVLTFHPHPAQVLRNVQVQVLTPLGRKLELIERVHPSIVTVVEPFTRGLASMSPEAFARELLCRGLSAKRVLVGSNFRFGQGRSGDVTRLAELGVSLGFELLTEPIRETDGSGISSTRVRELVTLGELEKTEALLGRPHALSGTVVHGAGRGRTLGVPTANLDRVDELLPPDGVYAVLVDRVAPDGGANRFGAGVLNIGHRPTVQGGFSVEVHVFDVDTDLYGAQLRVHLLQPLRAEQRFESLEALRAQIQVDIQTARKATENHLPLPEAGMAWY